MHVSQSRTIAPASVQGSIKAPASKSVVQRMLAAGLLAHGTSILNNYTPCDDALAAIDLARTLGAAVLQDGDVLRVDGAGASTVRQSLGPVRLNCGESGLSSRLFAPISLLFSNDVRLEGRGSLLKRPFGGMMRPVFEQLGVQYSDREGFLPLRLEGSLRGGVVLVDGSGGSQFLTGLLMSLPLLDHDSELRVERLSSKPYIDLTIDVAARFGIVIEAVNHEVFRIKGNQRYVACECGIEGDWSGASCVLVAGAIAGNVTVGNLNGRTAQADQRIVEALALAGARVDVGHGAVGVSHDGLVAFEFDATDCPDLFPALVALAANCEGTSRIRGIGRLATKESNRALTLQSEFNKLGVDVALVDDDMLVTGGAVAGGRVVSAHNDHRIAMALATAALTAGGPLTIDGTECVHKSYPGFWGDLECLTGGPRG